MAKTNEYIFQLYGKAQKGDKDAIKHLIQLHGLKYPDHLFHRADYVSLNRKQDLHTMYLHLT